VHFDRNGFGYTIDRETGETIVAEKFRSGGQLGDQRSILTKAPRPMESLGREGILDEANGEE